MKYRRLPTEMQARVMDYYDHKYQGKMFNEAVILNELSDCLRSVYTMCISIPTLQHCAPGQTELYFDDYDMVDASLPIHSCHIKLETSACSTAKGCPFLIANVANVYLSETVVLSSQTDCYEESSSSHGNIRLTVLFKLQIHWFKKLDPIPLPTQIGMWPLISHVIYSCSVKLNGSHVNEMIRCIHQK